MGRRGEDANIGYPALRALWVSPAAVIAFAIYVGLRYVPRSRLGYGFDKLAYTTPNQSVAFDALRSLRLPEWNPYLFGGAPHLANPQVGALYPLKFPLMWLPPHRAVFALLIIHLVLLGIGMLALLRICLRLRPAAACVGAFAAIGSGVVVSQLPHYEQLTTIAWIPWLLLAIDLLVEARVRLAVSFAATAAVVALMLLCGHQQPAYYALLLALAWTAGRAIDRRTASRAVIATAAMATGFALAAIQLAPTAVLVGRSVRSAGLTLASVDIPQFRLHGRDLLVALFGDVFSTVTPIGGEVYAALGAAGMLLLLIGAAAGLEEDRHRWHTACLVIAALGAIVLAMGTETPVYRVAFGLMPGLDLFRVPSRSIVIFDIAGSVLIGIGVHALLTGRGRRPAVAAIALLVVAGVAGLTLPVTLPSGRTVLAWSLAAGLTAAAALALARNSARTAAAAALVSVALLEMVAGAYQPVPEGALPATDATGKLAPFLRAKGGRSIIAGVEELGNQAYLRASLRPNINATERVRSLDGYDGGPWLTKRWTESMEGIIGKPFVHDLTIKSQLSAPVPPLLAARYGVRWFGLDVRTSDPTVTVPGWIGPVLIDGPLRLFENPEFESEALVYRKVQTADKRPLYEQMPALEDPFNTALIEGGRRRSCTTSCDVLPVRVARPRPERVVVAVEDAGAGTLVVAEGWDPGWSVRVDGEERRVLIADRNMIAVELRAGDGTVRFRYRTPGLRSGALVSGLTALGLLVALSLPAVRRRTSRRSGEFLRSSDHGRLPGNRLDNSGE